MGNLFSDNSEEKTQSCNIYSNFARNETGSFWGITGFEGIPQNFVMNAGGFIGMFILFVLLRKKAWNYGRVAIMKHDEKKWTDMFYGGYQEEDVSIRPFGYSAGRIPVVIASADTDQTSAGALSFDQHAEGKHSFHIEDTSLTSLSKLAQFSATSQHTDSASNKLHAESHSHFNPSIGVVGAGGSNNPVFEFDMEESSINDPRMEIISKKHPPSRGTFSMNSQPREESIKVAHLDLNINKIQDSGYFTWIKLVYNLTDEDYTEKSGIDCVHYLSFQRHLLLLASIMTVLTLGIILPINLHKSIQTDDPIGFSDTTITNLENGYDFIWAHITLSIVFLLLSGVIMRHFAKRFQTRKKLGGVSRTLMISGIRKENCREDFLRRHFESSYPGSEIMEISFAYEMAKLYKLEFQRLCALSAKIYYEEQVARAKRRGIRERPRIHPQKCGICGCQCCGLERDAVTYYSKELRKYTDQVEKERDHSINKCLGIAFVTFRSKSTAQAVMEDYSSSDRFLLQPPESPWSKKLRSSTWTVKYSPLPEEINWENLTGNKLVWYLRFFFVNLLMAFLVVVFTTPVYLFTTFAGPKIAKHKMHEHKTVMVNGTETQEVVEPMTVLAGIILDTIPTMTICILGATLAAVVTQSDMLIGFWTKTSQNLSEMIKTFYFLILMVIALPSLGVTSFSYFFNSQNSLSWSCIFYKENGVLFVNYLVTSSLIGTGAELMRLPELFLYVVKLVFAKSKGEIGSIRKSVMFDFPTGIFYAWTMLHFAIFTCFCVIYPIVTPFGLLYLFIKHWTDRYNMYFAYGPCKVDKKVHRTAIIFVILCMFMLQINLLAYVHFHLGENQNHEADDMKVATNTRIRALQIYSLVSFAISASIVFGQVCCNLCKDASPVNEAHWLQRYKPKGLNPNDVPVPANSAEWKDEDTVLEVELTMDSGNALVEPDTKEDDNEELIEAGDAGLDMNDTASLLSVGSLEELRLIGSKPYGRYTPPLLRPQFVKILKHNALYREMQTHRHEKAIVETATEYDSQATLNALGGTSGSFYSEFGNSGKFY